MSRDHALVTLKAATAALTSAQRDTANQWFAANAGLSHTCAFAEYREYVAYHAWLRVHENFTKFAPPAPKPAAKAAAVKPSTVATAKPAAPPPAVPSPNTTASSAGSFDFRGFLNDRVESSENAVFYRHGMLPPKRT